MEQNTVTMSIAEYNKLRDFKKSITEGKVFYKFEYYSVFKSSRETFVSKDDCVKLLGQEVLALNEKIVSLKKEKSELEAELGMSDEIIEFYGDFTKFRRLKLSDFKKMTIREFRRWKKNL